MYSLACINLSSEAHVLHALGSSQYPVLKVPKGSGPTLAFSRFAFVPREAAWLYYAPRPLESRTFLEKVEKSF